MNKPDAAKHYNGSPEYLRGLIEAAGVGQNTAADLVGISPRMMRYYVGEEGTEQHRPAPYAVQFALECLAV